MTEPSADVAATIASWSPRRHGEAVVSFAKGVVTAACPTSPERARALLFAAGKLAEFACLIGHRRTSPTRRTLRSSLRHLARHAVANAPPGPVPLPRERAKAPYSPRELAGYLALADAQPTALRRARANALVCLGAGAGSSAQSFAAFGAATSSPARAGCSWVSPVVGPAPCPSSPTTTAVF